MQMCHLNSIEVNAILMIIVLNLFALLMILHYSLTILNINANALSLIFFINANTLGQSMLQNVRSDEKLTEFPLNL